MATLAARRLSDDVTSTRTSVVDSDTWKQQVGNELHNNTSLVKFLVESQKLFHSLVCMYLGVVRVGERR
jgi:hypothetical protein